MEAISWKLIDKYFKDNPYNLVAHHLESYNDFFDNGINRVFRENNPIRFIEREDGEKNAEETRNQCHILRRRGEKGKNRYFGTYIFGTFSDYASIKALHFKVSRQRCEVQYGRMQERLRRLFYY